MTPTNGTFTPWALGDGAALGDDGLYVGGFPFGVGYSAALDTAFDGSFSTVLGNLRTLEWQTGLHGYDTLAAPSACTVELDNRDGTYSPSQAPVPLPPGALLQVRITFAGAVYPQWTGRLVRVVPSRRADGTQTVVLHGIDRAAELQTAKIAPSPALNQPLDALLRAAILDAGLVAPHERAGWVLGAAALGLDARLRDGRSLLVLDAARAVVPFAGDAFNPTRETDAYSWLRELLPAELGGRLFWEGGGRFVFHNRLHDAANITPSATLTPADIYDSSAAYGGDVVNSATVRYLPRRIGAPESLLYKEENLPITLAPSETRRIRAVYRDAANPAQRVAAAVVIPPSRVAGDVVIHDSATGGSPLNVDVRVETSASSTTFTLTNTAGITAYVQQLQVRGTPLYIDEAAAVTVRDVASVRAHGRHGRLFSVAVLSTEAEAVRYGRRVLAEHAQPVYRLREITLRLDGAATRTHDPRQIVRQAAGLTFPVGAALHLVDDDHAADYTLIGRTVRFSAVDGRASVVLALKPLARVPVWVLGSAALGVLGQSTRLAV